MSLPNEQTLDATLLVFISLSGGIVDKAIVPAALASDFGLTTADLQEKRADGRSRWTNMCEFSRERLAVREQLYQPGARPDKMTKIVRTM